MKPASVFSGTYRDVEKFRELSAASLVVKQSLSGSSRNESEEKDLSFANTYWPYRREAIQPISSLQGKQ